jgi:hypothetical protein
MYFGLIKKTNRDFVLYEQCIETLILSIYAILLFLPSQKYNIFCFENLQNDRVQCYLIYNIFFKIF